LLVDQLPQQLPLLLVELVLLLHELCEVRRPEEGIREELNYKHIVFEE
jgi:hypothetical protein